MKSIQLEIKTINKTLTYPVNKVYIFTYKYNKKIKKNEFHNPGPSRIIFEFQNKIINWLFNDLIVESNHKGNIFIKSMNLWQNIIQEKSYYNINDLKKAQSLFIIYKTKGLEYLNPDEIIEYVWSKNIVEIFKVEHLKIPYYIGGGF